MVWGAFFLELVFYATEVLENTQGERRTGSEKDLQVLIFRGLVGAAAFTLSTGPPLQLWLLFLRLCSVTSYFTGFTGFTPPSKSTG